MIPPSLAKTSVVLGEVLVEAFNITDYLPNNQTTLQGTEAEIVAALIENKVKAHDWWILWNFHELKKISDVCLLNESSIDALIEIKTVPRAYLKDALKKFFDREDKQVGSSSERMSLHQSFPKEPPYVCPFGKSHHPHTAFRCTHVKEWLYEAAYDGCLSCVQYAIEKDAINIHHPEYLSDHKNYSVLDWANFAVKHNVQGAKEVALFLETYKPP